MPNLEQLATVTEQRTLSIYGTVTRYPGDYEPVTVRDARKAVSMARRVRHELRNLLPKGTRTQQ